MLPKDICGLQASRLYNRTFSNIVTLGSIRREVQRLLWGNKAIS